MAERNDYATSFQTKDLLSAALGQSGLHFEEPEDNSIQDVFAALAAGGDFLSDGPRQQTATNSSLAPANSEPRPTEETYDNDLDELMGLLDNGIEKYQQNHSNVELPAQTNIRPETRPSQPEPSRPNATAIKKSGNNVTNAILVPDESNDAQGDLTIRNYASYKQFRNPDTVNLRNPNPGTLKYGHANFDVLKSIRKNFDGLNFPERPSGFFPHDIGNERIPELTSLVRKKR